MVWSEWKKFSSEYTNLEDYSEFCPVGGKANYSIAHTATDYENGTIFVLAESVNANTITLDDVNVTITNGTLNVLKEELTQSAHSRPTYWITYVANYSLEAGGKIDVNVTYPNALYNNGVHFLVIN